ncbi:polyamine aminopropyltransferase [Ferruginibacter sp.]
MTTKKENGAQWILLIAVFCIATCGLIYELVAGTLASYLLGDSVTQFSTIIGTYLFAMGIGSFFSKYFNNDILKWFIKIEILIGLIGGFSSATLFLLFPLVVSFRLVLYVMVLITGVLVGLEIPLLMRILKDKIEFKDLVSKVFSFDYIGALLASLIFPLILVPHLGLIRTSLFFGIINIAVGWYLAHYFTAQIKQAGLIKAIAILALLVEVVAFVFSDNIMSYSESLTYRDNVVYATSSPYQRIVITKNKRELRLHLNGNLQFSSADEYRYHEALVHPALSSVTDLKNVLVLGGGDGLAVREILKYPSVEKIQLVDLDAVMTKLFSTQEILVKLNEGSLSNKKVTVKNEDAFLWLTNCKQKYDAVVVDFPDPSNFSIGKLYSTMFYDLLKKVINPGGVAVIQSTSPYVAPKSFWCINNTIRAAGFFTMPYHNYVPSFGEWGYIIASADSDRHWFVNYPAGLKFLNPAVMQQMFVFPQDMQYNKPVPANKLNNQVLVGYFEEEWDKYLD